MGNRGILKIGEVHPQREVQGKNGMVPVLDFLAVNPAGQQFKYGIFAKKELFPYIKTGESIDAEITETDSKQVNPETGKLFINRNVVNIYVDGKPVLQAPQGGKPWGKSIETVKLEIDAKFRDTALMQAVELGKSQQPYNSAEDILLEAEKMYHWLCGEPVKPTPDGVTKAEGIKAKPDAKKAEKDTKELYGKPAKTPPVTPPATQKLYEIVLDMKWLEEVLSDPEIKTYAINWLIKTFKVKGTSVRGMLEQLAKEQQHEFESIVNEKLKE